MRKHLYSIWALLLLLICTRQLAFAQNVTFHDPSTNFADDFTIDNISISSGGSITVNAAKTVYFSGTLYRPSTLLNNGYVDIYPGDASGTLSAQPLPLAQSTTYQLTSQSPWSAANGSGIQSHAIAGNVQISPALMGSYTRLYAVFVNNNNPSSTFKEAVTSGSIPVTLPYTGPAITNLSKTVGNTGAATSIVITGSNLNGATQVLVNSQSIAVSATNSSQVSVTIPAGYAAGQYTIKVVTPAGTTNGLTFTIIAAATSVPTITLSPTSGVAGSTVVSITGNTDWAAYNSLVVYFGSTQAVISSVATTVIKVTVPAGLANGQVNVYVSTSVGSSNTQPFTVTPPPAPSIALPYTRGPVGTLIRIRRASPSNPVIASDVVNFGNITVAPMWYDAYGMTLRVPANVPVGPVTITITISGTVSQPVTFTVIPTNEITRVDNSVQYMNILASSTAAAAGTGSNVGTIFPGNRIGDKLRLLTDVDWSNYNTLTNTGISARFGDNSNPAVAVQFVNANPTSSSSSSNYNVEEEVRMLYVTIPDYVKNGDVTITIYSPYNNSVSLPIHINVYIPFATSLPCGANAVTCSDQCVDYGATLQLLKGRVLADKNSSAWNSYLRECVEQQVSSFAASEEYEQVQWQRSFDQSNWTDISSATEQNYQPGPTFRNTYYRRVSTHLEGRFNVRAYWYTSGTVAIIVGPGTPSMQQNSYTVCPNGSIRINVASEPGVVSYKWHVDDDDFIINGQVGPDQDETTVPYATFTAPAGYPTGSVGGWVMVTNTCGRQSQRLAFSLNVTTGSPLPAPSGAKWTKASSNVCVPTYNLTMSPVNGANPNGYSASDSNGASVIGTLNAAGTLVTFPFQEEGPQTGLTATVTATSGCGNSSYTTTAATLMGPGPRCRPSGDPTPEDPDNPTTPSDPKQPSDPTQPESIVQSMYPNPTTEQVTLSTGGQAAQVTFYDVMGRAKKTIMLREDNVETQVNLRDLPRGVYHVKVLIKGKKPVEKQLFLK